MFVLLLGVGGGQSQHQQGEGEEGGDQAQQESCWRELTFLVDNLGLHLVDIREDCVPVVFADNLGVVSQLGTVGKVSHQHVERLEVRGF